MNSPVQALDRVFAAIDAATDEMVDFTSEMIRVPTVHPPGDCYVECAALLGRRLARRAFAVD